ncbi:MAG: hypothetical protein F2839_00380 [Actinobacteria bacterium]|uniref:Unannotated protein n=1 Tax=freshwater metagenome TaxID=449393 RepID=A0A6J5YI22_9ZZZZ|nr:hypothetical protein [Actinomycetota bacterium]
MRIHGGSLVSEIYIHFGWSLYFVLACIFVLFFGIVGTLLFDRILNLRPHKFPFAERTVFGYATFILAGLVISRFGTSPARYRLMIALLVILGLLLNDFLKVRNSPMGIKPGFMSRVPRINVEPSYVVALIAGSCAIAAFYFQVFQTHIFRGFFLTSYSAENNDLGSYVLQSQNILTSGYRDSGQVLDSKVHLLSQLDHPSTQTFMASLAGILGVNTWKVGLLALFISALIAILAMMNLIEALKLPTGSSTAVLAVSCIFTPYYFYLLSCGFLAQLMAIPIIIMIFSLLLKSNSREDNKWDAVGAGFLLAVLASFSPENALMMIGFGTGIAIVLSCYPSGVLSLTGAAGRMRTWLVPYLGVFAVIAALNPFTINAFRVVEHIGKQGIAGWELYIWNIWTWLGISSVAGSGQNLSTQLPSLVVLLALLGFLARDLVRFRTTTPVTYLIVFLSAIFVLSVGIWGTTGYQSWKLVLTYSSVFVVAMYGLAMMQLKNPVGVVSVALFVLGISIGTSHLSTEKGQVGIAIESKTISPELQRMLLSPEFSRQKGVDLILAPIQQTMLATSVPSIPVNMVEVTYVSNGKRLPVHYSCTLMTRTEFEGQGLDKSTIVRESKRYVLVNTPRCD